MSAELMASVMVFLATLGTLVARWSETNPEKKWYVRAARVADFTQVIDSTRKLGD